MPICFVGASDGQLPDNAWQGGDDNGPQYIARCIHEGALIPGKFVPKYGLAYIPFEGKEYEKSQYEILVQDGPENLIWVPACDGDLGSTGAPVRSGRESSGGPLYVGRAQIKGTWTVGKVKPEDRTCYVSYGGKEHAISSYQVLCVKEMEL